MTDSEKPGAGDWTLEEWEALFGDFVNGGMPDRLCAYLASEGLERPQEESMELDGPPEEMRQNPRKTLAWWMACGAMARRAARDAELKRKRLARALRWQAQLRLDAEGRPMAFL